MAEIKEFLKASRAQEEQLLNGLRASMSQINPVSTEIRKGVIGELAGTAAGELFGLRSLGRRVGRALVVQGDKQGLKSLQQAFESQHNSNVTSVISFLSSVSERIGI